MHLSESFRHFPWDVFAEEVRKVKKQVRDLHMQLQDFGHSHDREFDNFLSTIPIAVGIVDDFHLWIENEKASSEAVQYIISKRFSEVSDRTDQVNKGFAEWEKKSKCVE